MNPRVLTTAVKIYQSYGIPESGIPERAFVKKYYRRSLALGPYPSPSLIFSAHIILRRPHDLNAWNRLEKAQT